MRIGWWVFSGLVGASAVATAQEGPRDALVGARFEERTGAGRVDIALESRLGPYWKVQEVVVAMDGRRVVRRLLHDPPRRVELLHGVTAPGEHELQALVRLRGQGGPFFSYLEGYRLLLRDSGVVEVPDRAALDLRLVLFERPDPTVSLERRPRLRMVLGRGSAQAVPP